MAHQISDTPTGPQNQPYELVPGIHDASVIRNEKTSASTAARPIQPHHPSTFNQAWSVGQVVVTASIPLVALIAWLGFSRANVRLFDTFAGERIGGRLSQAEAKAIDAITGAILAPLFMAAVNHIWFDSARVSVVNEQQKHSIPLRTLVAASSTSGGNYDLLNLRDLLLGKTPRLFLFALLTLLSAVSRTALSNTIAYEAFSEIGTSTTSAELRLQTDTTIAKNTIFTPSITMQLYDFDLLQNAKVAKDVTALLTDLSYQGAASKLTNGTYVSLNVTTQSLNNLPQSVVELNQVPAYRLSLDCVPALPWSFSVLQPLSFFNTQISLMLNTTKSSNNTVFQANYPGVPDNMRTGEQDSVSYVGFSLLTYQEVYLGYLDRFNLTNKTAQSPYGEISYRAFNLTQFGFVTTNYISSVSGLRCQLYREHGSANATRQSSNLTSAGTWDVTSAEFSSSQKKEPVSSMLSRFQWTNLNFHAPGSPMPGLGPALSKKYVQTAEGGSDVAKDIFANFASNFLYASGETQRIIYEVAASSTNSSRRLPEYFIKVPALETQQHYRITYVPSILLVGLLGLLASSAITALMALFGRRSFSARTHRQVNVTRLILDSVFGLRNDRNIIATVSQGSNNDVQDFAAKYRVNYVTSDDDHDGLQIVLEAQ